MLNTDGFSTLMLAMAMAMARSLKDSDATADCLELLTLPAG